MSSLFAHLFWKTCWVTPVDWIPPRSYLMLDYFSSYIYTRLNKTLTLCEPLTLYTREKTYYPITLLSTHQHGIAWYARISQKMADFTIYYNRSSGMGIIKYSHLLVDSKTDLISHEI